MAAGAPYFSQASTRQEQCTYYTLLVVTILYTIVIIGCQSGLLYPPCHLPPREPPLAYANLDYVEDPCHHVRYLRLLGLTTWECMICTRVLASVVFGTVIG